MPDLNDYKIPVVLGINDSPVPPNFQDNGLGCNGAYFIEKYNSLIDDIGPGLTYQPISASGTVETWVVYGVDTTGGPLTLTLPAAVNGDYVVFIDRLNNFGANNLTINATGDDTIAGADEVVLNYDQESLTLLYDAGVSNWIIREAVILGGTETPNPHDARVTVSDADIAAGTLTDKIVAGSNVTLSRVNPAGYEQLRITADVGDSNTIVNGTSQVTIPTSGGIIEITIGGVLSGYITEDSVFFGNLAGSNGVGSVGNVGIGDGSAAALTVGTHNTIVGSNAGNELTTGVGNAVYGSFAGASLNIGDYNVYVGNVAGDTTGDNPYSGLSGFLTGSNNLVLGYGALPSAVGSSNEIVLGNSAHTTLSIPGVNLKVSSTSMAAATIGQALVYSGSGIWAPGNSGSGFVLTSVKTANYTAADGEFIPCDTTSGSFTVTTPALGKFKIIDIGGNTTEEGFAVNNLTVAAATGTVMGQATITLDVGTTSPEFERIGTDWRIVNFVH